MAKFFEYITFFTDFKKNYIENYSVATSVNPGGGGYDGSVK
ncbi:MAG: hypothetical protein ACP5K7_09845 [Verrucomicrobiia bacterium]